MTRKSSIPVAASFLLSAILLSGLSLAGEGQPSCHAAPAAEPATEAEASDTGSVSGLPTALLAEPLDLRNQDGQTVKFPQDVLGDRLVAVNFVFTRCSTICPPMGAAFGRLQRKLAKRPDLNVDLISVSIDPVHDTPERLTRWADRFGREDGWTLLTGSKPDIDQVLRAMDAFTPDKFEHAALLLIGNPETGRWTRIDGLAGPKETIAALERLKSETVVATANR